MFKLILTHLFDFNLVHYISVRVVAAAVSGLLLTWFLGPGVIRFTTKFKLNQSIRTDGPQTHLKKIGTPTMGGLMIVGCTLLSLFLWQDFGNQYVWILVLTLVGFGTLGFLDDYLKIQKKNSDGLMARVKLTGQFVLAVVISCWIYTAQQNEFVSSLYIPFYKYPVMDLGIFWIPVSVFIIIGSSNAVNLTDGLDGLATSVYLVALSVLGILSYLSGHRVFAEYLQIPFLPNAAETTVPVAALWGSCLGFLWYNCYPAKIMMGDTGSLSLGAFLGVVALLVKREILLVIIAFVFITEVLSVMIQVLYYKKTKKRFFRMAPLHHHFELLGWSEPAIVTRFTVISILFGFLALLSLKVQ